MGRTRRRRTWSGAVMALLAVLVVVVVIGVIVMRGRGSTTATGANAAPSIPTSCHIQGQLPDPACTPGVADPAVTEGNLRTTICHGGWSRRVRPPRSYTDDLKRRQLLAYGLPGSTSAYEEDHLIPISLGGSPTDPRNLWPEPGASPNPKDRVEGAAAGAVCGGRITLSSAQKAIATDWIAFGHQLGAIP
jgi:hypothetical protein